MRIDDNDWKHLMEVLNEFAEAFIEESKSNLSMDASNASYTLENSLKYRIETSDGEVNVIISLADYWKYVNNGRGPGKMPPLENIRKWIEIKPVLPEVRDGKLPTTEQLAFLVARKIGNEGTQGTHFFDRAKESTIEKFKRRINEAIEMDIADLVGKEINDILDLI